MSAYEKLARNLCAAVVAHRLGISLAHARKAYIKDDEPVGAFWLMLAERLDHGAAENIDEQMQPKPPKGVM